MPATSRRPRLLHVPFVRKIEGAGRCVEPPTRPARSRNKLPDAVTAILVDYGYRIVMEPIPSDSAFIEHNNITHCMAVMDNDDPIGIANAIYDMIEQTCREDWPDEEIVSVLNYLSQNPKDADYVWSAEYAENILG